MKSVLLLILLTVGAAFSESVSGCVRCPPGFYVDKVCEAGDPDSRVCLLCPTGRFAPEWNAKRQCKECKTYCYGENEIKIEGCNAYHDIVCGCPPAYWHEKYWTSDAKCLPFQECGKGVGVKKPGTNISDVECTECIEGVNFSPVSSSSETCRPCRNCAKDGSKETKACTVRSDAECDIPTSKSTTKDPTTSLTSGNITDDDKMSKNDKPSVVGPVVGGVVGFVILVVVVPVVVKYRRPITRFFQYRNQARRQYRPPADANNDVNAVCNAVVIQGGGQGVQTRSLRTRSSTTVNSNLVRRSYSSLELKPDTALENDVFPWLAGKLGETFLVNTYKSLPGIKLTPTDIEHACHPYQNPPNLAAKIDAVFRKWRDKNIENKTDTQLFIDICKTLSQAGPDDAAIVEEMEREFAQ